MSDLFPKSAGASKSTEKKTEHHADQRNSQKAVEQNYRDNLKDAYRNLASAIPLEEFWDKPNDPNRVNYQLKEYNRPGNKKPRTKSKEPQQPGGR